jgi:O-antigen/teichoic acid export membrane protein
MSLTNRLSRNTFILLLNNAGTAVLAFGLTVIIARGLGDVALGQYVTVMAWVLPLSLVVDFGIGTLITRDVAQNHTLAANYLRTTTPFRWLLGGGIIVLMWIIAPILSDDATIVTGLRIGIFLALIDSLFASYTAVFRAWENMLPILLLNISLLSMQVIGSLIVVWGQGDVRHLVAVIVLADTIQLSATWLTWRYLTRKMAVDESDSHHTPIVHLSFRKILKLTFPFAVAGILAMLQIRVVILLLEQFTDAQQVGWYAAANRLIEAARLLPNALFGALFPALAAMIHDQANFQKLFRRVGWGIIGYSCVIGLGSLILAKPMIDLIFGVEFKAAAPVMTILAWTLIPSLLRNLFTLRLYAYGREKTVNIVMVLTLGVQIGVGLLLIPSYKLTGAAWTVLIGETILALSLWGIIQYTTLPIPQPSLESSSKIVT